MIANHRSQRTTKLYDRTSDAISRESSIHTELGGKETIRFSCLPGD